MKEKKEVKTEINVEIPGNLQPVYSNSIQINHKDDEFTLSFVQMIPMTNKGHMKAVVAITPKHAKRLLRALQDNIKKYEGRFGEIELPEEKNKSAGDERMYM
ncbi:MAG: DUF3467 domain-containing protein [Halobacteriota archaeon]|nr:DUF3467 domain-containing protein [Halobacteriota archaeon]